MSGKANRDWMIGQRYGRLVVTRDLGRSKVRCKCDCGKEVSVAVRNLTSGATQSCGCLRKESIVKTALKVKSDRYERYGFDVDKIMQKNPTKKSTSGERDVFPTRSGKYMVRIMIGRKNHYIGMYGTIGEAAAARDEYISGVLNKAMNK